MFKDVKMITLDELIKLGAEDVSNRIKEEGYTNIQSLMKLKDKFYSSQDGKTFWAEGWNHAPNFK